MLLDLKLVHRYQFFNFTGDRPSLSRSLTHHFQFSQSMSIEITPVLPIKNCHNLISVSPPKALWMCKTPYLTFKYLHLRYPSHCVLVFCTLSMILSYFPLWL